MERVVQDIAQLQIIRIIGLIVSCSLELMVVGGESVAILIAEIAGSLTTGSNARLPSSFLTAARRCSACEWEKSEEFEKKLPLSRGLGRARSSWPSRGGIWLGGRCSPLFSGEANIMGTVWLRCQVGGRV